jgi:hypothetical protein
MARPLLIADPKNATIEELKQVSWVESNQTDTRFSAIQMLLAGANRDLNTIERIWLMMTARWFNNQICENKKTIRAFESGHIGYYRP